MNQTSGSGVEEKALLDHAEEKRTEEGPDGRTVSAGQQGSADGRGRHHLEFPSQRCVGVALVSGKRRRGRPPTSSKPQRRYKAETLTLLMEMSHPHSGPLVSACRGKSRPPRLIFARTHAASSRGIRIHQTSEIERAD